MPTRSDNLHGGEPQKSETALLLIDVINDLEFDGAERMLPAAVQMADQIARLKQRARERQIPVIYVNDNFGLWRSDFRAQVQHCLNDGVRGQPIVERLRPEPDDYFVLKPKHSGFYSTVLELLLDHLGAQTLILTGIAGNICVLFTANDAYVRDYRVIVPQDAIVSNTPEENEHALRQMRDILKADTRPTTDLPL